MNVRCWPLLLVLVLFSPSLSCRTDTTPQQAQPTPQAQDAETSGFGSPGAAFDGFRQAVQQGDWQAATDCLTSQSQEALAGMLVFAGSLIAMFDQEKGKQFAELLEKHGLGDLDDASPDMAAASEIEAVRQLARPIRDKRAFVAEAMSWLSDSADESKLEEIVQGTLEELNISGDRATAVVRFQGKTDPVEFEKTARGWLLHLPDDQFAMQPDGAMAVETGSPQFDDFDFEYDEGEPLEAGGAVTVDQFESSWKTDVQADAEPAIDVITRLATECGMQLYEQPEMKEPLQQPVTIQLSNVSRLAAIDQICEQVGLYPRYQLRKIAFARRPRPLPVEFAGPFQIEIQRIEENVPYASGSLALRVIGTNLPLPVLALLNEADFQMHGPDDEATGIIVDQVTGTGGADDLISDDAGYGMMPTATKTAVILGNTLGLKNLLRGVRELELSGRIRLVLPTEIDSLEFRSLETGTKVEKDGITMTVTGSDSGEWPSVELEFDGVAYDSLSVLGKSADGKSLSPSGTGGFDFEGRGSLSVTFDQPISGLEVQIVKSSEPVVVPFQLANIPLQLFEQMPETIAALQFTADSPITVRFVEIKGSGDDRKILAKAQNECNKDAQTLSMTLHYLDENGEELDDFPYTYSGSLNLIPSGETIDLDISAFFMPEQTRSVRIVVDEVRFADADQWSRPD